MTLFETDVISREVALQIAREDAVRAYRELDHFQVAVQRKPGGWHVDYELADEFLCGGGPHYVIDATTGEITWKRYDQ